MPTAGSLMCPECAAADTLVNVQEVEEARRYPMFRRADGSLDYGQPIVTGAVYTASHLECAECGWTYDDDDFEDVVTRVNTGR